VPAKGYAQKGLVGYLFVHAGWLHLIFNLLFLYVVGPFLEDNWGRVFFLIFYLLGGAVAGAAQMALDTTSSIPIVGASGAVAACMGAFALRFSTRGVRIFYWFLFVFVGTFTVPAWLWTGFWIAREVAYFKLLGAGAQVAFMAHIGGFAFGAVFALVLKLANFEKVFIQPGLDQAQGVVRQNPHVARGMTALHAGKKDVARAAFRSALQEDSNNLDAAMGMARLAAEAGDSEGATRALNGVLNNAVSKNDDQVIDNALIELGGSFEPKVLRPATAFRVGQRIEKKQPEVAVSCYQAAAGGEGALAGKALIQAAELLMNRLSNAGEALAVAEQARSADLTLEQKTQLEALVAQAGAGAAPSYGTEQALDVAAPSLELDLGEGPLPGGPLPGAADPSAVDLDIAPLAPAVSPSPTGLELDLGGSGPSSVPAMVDPTAVDLDVAPSVGLGLELDTAPSSVSMPDALELDLSPGSDLPPAAQPVAPQPQSTLPPQSQPTPAAQPVPQPTPQPAQPQPAPQPAPVAPAATARAPGVPAASPTARAPGAPAAASATARAPGAPAAQVARRSSREVVPLGKPVVEMTKFVGRFANGLTVQMQQGAKVNLSFDVVSSIAFGVVDAIPGRAQRILVLDLVLPPRQGTLRVLRFYSDAMGLDKLFPAGTPPTEALRTLVSGLTERCTVRPPADADKASRGDYPRFGDLKEYDSAYYG